MASRSIFAMSFSKIRDLYIQKAERKNRTASEVDSILCWLSGYSQEQLQHQIRQGKTLQAFLDEAPAFHPNAALIKGIVCGVRVEDIEDPLMKKVRSLDKLIDELAKGKAMDKILRH